MAHCWEWSTMRRPAVALLTIALVLAARATASAQVGDDEARVNLTADDEPIEAVAAQIAEQTGVQVAITDNTEKSLTGELVDKTVEESVRLLAESARATWLRAYIIELRAPDVPYTAAELMQQLEETRNVFFEGLTDEERGSLLAQWRERMAPEDEAQAAEGEQQRGRGRGRMFGFGGQEMPGGGVARMGDDGAQGDQGGPGGPGGRGDFMRYDDELRGLLMPARFDTVSLDLTDVSLGQAISEFTAQTGFLVLVDEELDGVVTLQLEDAELDEALAAFAEAAGAQWRPFYVLGQPRELSEAEVAERQEQFGQRREEMFARMWGDFWQMTAQERADRIQRIVDRIENIPPERMARGQRRLSRMLPRLVDYTTTLTPEQRLELKPLLQAMARLAQ